jgi:hypothetical protein
MKPGRPTLPEQKNIQKTLLSYYENNVEAYTASRETMINYKTVLKYYKKWNHEIFEQDKEPFLKRTKISKEKCILALDADINSFSKSIKEIENLM